MPNVTLAEDIEQVRRTNGVLQSALLWIQGNGARIQAAIDLALANGATAEELAPLSAIVDETEAKANEVAAAIAANP